MYIHEKNNWTQFYWNEKEVSPLIEDASRNIGRLYGRLEMLGFETQLQAVAENISEDLIRSSEIEGVSLNTDEVRSSVARHLGIESMLADDKMPSRAIDSLVNVIMDATQHYNEPISKERLCAWQAALFESGFAGGVKVEVGRYRSCKEQIVSGAFGRERIHYVAPAPERVEDEMDDFIEWFNKTDCQSQIIRSAIAHFWFVCIHPFEDGNGRLSRLLAEICLARGDKSKMRFYSIAASINKDKKKYYDILETVQKGNGDITIWLVWYVQTLLKAVETAGNHLSNTLHKTLYWNHFEGLHVSDRQRRVLNIFLDGYDAKISSHSWSKLAKCSSDTALRDLQDLAMKGMLVIDDPDAKRFSYHLANV